MGCSDVAVRSESDSHALLVAGEVCEPHRQQTTNVRLSALCVSDSPRLEGECTEHIRTLLESDLPFPPITVHRQTMRIIDGMHRFRAAQLRGDTEIEVEYFDGAEPDAFILAVESNVRHGLPLSLADRKAAAARIVLSHPQWSDRTVALAVGLSHKTVGAIRTRPTGEDSQLCARLGGDGRIRPVDGANGRRRAGQLLRNDPETSLRQVAKAAGISATTARDVRDRLSRGENPVLPRQRGADGTTRRPAERPAHPEPDDQRPAEHAPAEQPATEQSTTEYPTEALGVPGVELPVLVAYLKDDPALRFNEVGRRLLRLLHLHLVGDEGWERLINNVPEHHTATVAKAAEECSQAWQRVANRLAGRD